nr:MAG TPA: hypothetical protein [Caudoviricetes sp.]
MMLPLDGVIFFIKCHLLWALAILAPCIRLLVC